MQIMKYIILPPLFLQSSHAFSFPPPSTCGGLDGSQSSSPGHSSDDLSVSRQPVACSLLTPTLDSCLVTCCDCRGRRRLTGLFHRKHRGIAWIRESWRRQTACKHAHTLTTCRRTPGRFPPGPLARCMPASCFSKGWAIGSAVVDGVWFHLLHDLPERSLKLRLILPSLLALQLSFWRRPPSRSCSTLEVEVGAHGIDVPTAHTTSSGAAVCTCGLM